MEVCMKRFILAILVCLSFFACTAITGKLSGVYMAEEDALIDSVEFETDGTCYSSSMGFRIAMQYDIKGNKVIIGTGGQMMPTFEIVDSNTLRGITVGVNGKLYKKE
jgi:hypothetical protein